MVVINREVQIPNYIKAIYNMFLRFPNLSAENLFDYYLDPSNLTRYSFIESIINCQVGMTFYESRKAANDAVGLIFDRFNVINPLNMDYEPNDIDLSHQDIREILEKAGIKIK